MHLPSKTILLFEGCQDPWYVNSENPLPVCDNITKILGSYDRGRRQNFAGNLQERIFVTGPARNGFDGQQWDRPYMAEKEVASIKRNEMQCLSPCRQVHFETATTYFQRDK